MRLLSLAASVLVVACDAPSPGALEAEAADCDAGPLLSLAGQPHLVLLNAYYLQEESARAVRRGLSQCAPLEETLRKARALGVTVIRTSAFNDGEEQRGDSAIQVDRLQYDEVALRGLDLVLARAAAYGVRLVMPLGNYWDDYGGVRRYVGWAGLANPVEGDPRFFTERAVIDHYKEHVRRMLERVSTVDGQRYGSHPAVLAWELLNEPRNRGLDGRGDALRAWIDEVGVAVRAHTAKPLTTGEEGFDAGAAYDPALPLDGQFRKNLESPVVDFGSIHFFPESWGVPRERTARAGATWLRDHMAAARQVGKPLLLGEVGMRNDGVFTLAERRALIRGWLRCARRAGLAGAGLWMFAYDARPDEWDRHTFYFRDGTDPGDPANRYADLVVEAAAP